MSGTASSPSYRPSEHQRHVDELVASVRAEDPQPGPTRFKPAPRPSPPSEDPLDHRIAEELEFIRRHLEQLGGTLVADPVMLHRHSTQLQAVDQINQILGHLARVIAAEDKRLAVSQVSLEALRGRLQRRPLSSLF